MNRSIQMVISMLALLKIGAAYLPIDTNHPKDRVDYLLSNISAKKLLISNEFLDKYNDYDQKMVFDQFWANRFNYSLNSSSTKEFGNNIAYILYTSGSTGMPKCVEIQQNCLHNFLLSMQKEPGITAADTMLSITTITFDIAELGIYLPLISGASLHIVDMEVARDGRKLLEVIKKENISIVQATPFTWRMMLEFGWEEKFYARKFSLSEDSRILDFLDRIAEVPAHL